MHSYPAQTTTPAVNPSINNPSINNPSVSHGTNPHLIVYSGLEQSAFKEAQSIARSEGG